MLSLIDGFVNDSSILEVAPSIFNIPFAKPITQLNECAFLVPLKSREEVTEVCKMGTFEIGGGWSLLYAFGTLVGEA